MAPYQYDIICLANDQDGGRVPASGPDALPIVIHCHLCQEDPSTNDDHKTKVFRGARALRLHLTSQFHSAKWSVTRMLKKHLGQLSSVKYKCPWCSDCTGHVDAVTEHITCTHVDDITPSEMAPFRRYFEVCNGNGESGELTEIQVIHWMGTHGVALHSALESLQPDHSQDYDMFDLTDEIGLQEDTIGSLEDGIQGMDLDVL